MAIPTTDIDELPDNTAADDADDDAADGEGLADNDFIEAVSAETARLIDDAEPNGPSGLEGLMDNLATVDRRAAKAEETNAPPAPATPDPAAPATVDPPATPAVVDPPANPPAALATDEPPSLTDAQATLEYLTKTFGDDLSFSFQANGAEQKVSIKELKTRAAGYMGQDGVHRTLAEATTQREAAAKLKADAETLTGRVKHVLDAIDTPESFIDKLVLSEADDPVAYLTGLKKIVDEKLDEIHDDPRGFRLERELVKMRREMQGTKGATPAEPAPKEAAPKPAEPASTSIPDDYGFIAGRGYPEQFAAAALVALDVASKATGRDNAFADKVVASWKADGMKVPVHEVFKSMVQTAAADSTKLGTAANPPIPARTPNKGGTRGKGSTEKGKTGGSWDSIERTLAQSIRAAQKAGTL